MKNNWKTHCSGCGKSFEEVKLHSTAAIKNGHFVLNYKKNKDAAFFATCVECEEKGLIPCTRCETVHLYGSSGVCPPKFFKRKTYAQNRAIFKLKEQRGLTHDDLRELCAEESNGQICFVRDLDFETANKVIHRLGGTPFPTNGKSRRDIQRQRQKAGVKQIATKPHLKLMRDLAQKRGITPAGLKTICQQTIKRDYPVTTAETNKIIKALRSMNKRGNPQLRREAA